MACAVTSINYTYATSTGQGVKCDIEEKHHQKLGDLFWVWDQFQRRNQLTATFRVILIIVKVVKMALSRLIPHSKSLARPAGRDEHHY